MLGATHVPLWVSTVHRTFSGAPTSAANASLTVGSPLSPSAAAVSSASKVALLSGVPTCAHAPTAELSAKSMGSPFALFTCAANSE
ncbi:MAG: hypothetical protein LBC65_03555 [Oscillospiraceae bacterium]|nr:hypothetical protein [Oscillospiraceae bacterium]